MSCACGADCDPPICTLEEQGYEFVDQLAQVGGYIIIEPTNDCVVVDPEDGIPMIFSTREQAARWLLAKPFGDRLVDGGPFR